MFFFASLALVAYNLEHIAEYESHSKEIIGRLNWLSYLSAAMAVTALEQRQPHSDASAKQAMAQETTLRSELESTAPLFQTTQTKSLFTQFNAAALQLVEDKSLTESQMNDILRLQLPSLRREILAAERNKTVMGRAMTYASRDLILKFIWVSIFVVTLIAAYCMFKYGRMITDRIESIAANIYRFESGKELQEPTSQQTDELDLLSNTFYSIANKLKDAERMKRDLLSVVSHDLRSPLTSIQVMFELMKTGNYGEFNSEGEKLLERASNTCDRIVRLAGDLLQIERLESQMFDLEKREVTIEKLFADSAKSVESLANVKAIQIAYEQDQTTIFADADRMVQVLVNLLSNSIKFSPEQSKITMTAQHKDSTIIICLEDQGIGIPAEQLPHIFDRFKQVKTSDATKHKGAGLGLWIAQELVKLHGGQITCESTLGVGSKFLICLPHS